MVVRNQRSVRARLTSKGQITLPIELRRRFDLQAGDEVEFEMGNKDARLVPVKKRKLSELAGILHEPGRKKPTDAELSAAIGRYLGREDARTRDG